MHSRLAKLAGVRAVRRPVTTAPEVTGTTAGLLPEQFDLYYVRIGPRSAHPLVVIPGGPGAASVALYRGMRRRAAAAGLDVLMVEHRGVGLSRHDDRGRDLPPEALTIEQAVDDIAAVLDDAKIDTAVVYGSSYGTYLAAGVGVRHPDRVHAMILDSPVLSAADIHAAREAIRRLLWDGDDPETAELASKVRRLVIDGVLTPAGSQLAAAVYGLAGPEVLQRQLDLLLAGRRRLWSALGWAARFVFERKAPYHNEPDLVGRIGYRELDYGAEPDGMPLDPAAAFREMAVDATEFEQEPYDLMVEMPKFGWPTVVISGGRDLITPPAIAQRVRSLIPNSVLVNLDTAGHSMLDLREQTALEIVRAVYAGETDGLEARSGELDAKPAGLGVRLLIRAMDAAAIVESALPAAVERVARRVRAS